MLFRQISPAPKFFISFNNTFNGISLCLPETLTATISGVEFIIATDSNSSGGTRSAGNVIVPDNATYMIVASGSGVSGFLSWHELR